MSTSRSRAILGPGRLLAGTAALLVFVGAAWRLAPAAAVDVADVDRGEVVALVLGVGTVESDEEVRAAFTATGRLLDLAVDEGDSVRQGQALGTLDLEEAVLDVDVARANESEARAATKRARAELDRATAAAEAATRDRARADALFADGVIPDTEHQVAVDREAVALAELDAREAAYAQALAGQDIADRSTRARQARAADRLLESPLDGVVVRRHVDPGQVVVAGAPVLTLASTTQVHVRAWVDESALGRLSVGQDVQVRFRSEPDAPRTGTLERIGRTVDRETHEVLVDIGLSPSADLALGQRADAWIIVASRPDVVRVPRGWCDESADQCFVERDGRAVSVPVSFGLIGSEYAEVQTGLAPGDRLVRPASSGTAIVGRRTTPVGES